jgi:transcription elongation factor GreA
MGMDAGLALSLFGRSSLSNQIHYLTVPGLAKLKKELQSFRTDKREEVAKRIQLANSIGGPVDNAEYEEAKNEQSFIEGRIIDLANILNKAEIIKERKGPKSTVEVGATVTVYNKTRNKKDQYFIVGSHESDPANGKISNVSPIGQALLQKKVGDIAKVQVPAGIINFEILKIR